MRVAVLGLISAFSVLPLAANAFPTGLSTPTVVSARGVELVAGSSPNADQYTSKARRARHHPATRGSASPSDNMAGQLNAQEAARGAGAPAPAYGGATNVYGQPNQVYGIPGAGQPSPSSDSPVRR
jgi:hypothetical protein